MNRYVAVSSECVIVYDVERSLHPCWVAPDLVKEKLPEQSHECEGLQTTAADHASWWLQWVAWHRRNEGDKTVLGRQCHATRFQLENGGFGLRSPLPPFSGWNCVVWHGFLIKTVSSSWLQLQETGGAGMAKKRFYRKK